MLSVTLRLAIALLLVLVATLIRSVASAFALLTGLFALARALLRVVAGLPAALLIFTLLTHWNRVARHRRIAAAVALVLAAAISLARGI